MEEMIGFVLFIAEAAAWYFAFKTAVAFWEAYGVWKEAKVLEEDLHDKLTKLVHNVKPEKHADVLYWFDDETDKFLAQGKTIDDIRAHLKERYKQDVFLVDGKMLLAGPDFAPMDISDKTPSEVGKYIADTLLLKLLPKSIEE
jgi:hypothetical protein